MRGTPRTESSAGTAKREKHEAKQVCEQETGAGHVRRAARNHSFQAYSTGRPAEAAHACRQGNLTPASSTRSTIGPGRRGNGVDMFVLKQTSLSPPFERPHQNFAPPFPPFPPQCGESRHVLWAQRLEA